MAGQFGNIGKYQLKDIGWAPDRGLATQCAVCAQQAVSGMQHSAQRDTHPHLIPAIINAGKLPHNPGDHSRLTAQLECKCLSAPKGHLSACTIIPVSKSSESVIPGCKQWTHAADYHAHDKYPIPMQAWEDTTKSAYIQFLNSQIDFYNYNQFQHNPMPEIILFCGTWSSANEFLLLAWGFLHHVPVGWAEGHKDSGSAAARPSATGGGW